MNKTYIFDCNVDTGPARYRRTITIKSVLYTIHYDRGMYITHGSSAYFSMKEVQVIGILLKNSNIIDYWNHEHLGEHWLERICTLSYERTEIKHMLGIYKFLQCIKKVTVLLYLRLVYKSSPGLLMQAHLNSYSSGRVTELFDCNLEYKSSTAAYADCLTSFILSSYDLEQVSDLLYFNLEYKSSFVLPI